jgi:hypothetical protein
MNPYTNIEQRAEALLSRRGIAGHTAATRFVKDFKAYLVYFDATGIGSAEHTLSLLEDDNNLTDSNILNSNFACKLDDLISETLRNDTLFIKLFDILMDNNGKGVGAGELALPLILADYRFSNESDGMFGDGKKVEIKKNGASLKPVKTGLTEKGLVDQLNKKYWAGTVPGMKDKKKHAAHVSAVSDPALYADYFAELYVECDVAQLSEEAKATYTDANAFNTALGKFALREYKRVDGWNNIIYIDADKRKVVNIADPSDIDDLKLSFMPKLKRGKDTQAIADGYVNVKI